MIEREAAYRAIALAELVDQPIQIFHVSCPEVAEEIARAQARGLKVWGETCPQYFVLQPRIWIGPASRVRSSCAVLPRATPATCEALWEEVRRGTLDVISSDHSG